MQHQPRLAITGSSDDASAVQRTDPLKPQQQIGTHGVGGRSLYISLVLAAFVSGLAGWQIAYIATLPRVEAAIPSVEHPNLQFLPRTLRQLARQLHPNDYQRIAIAMFATISAAACCIFATAARFAQHIRGEAAADLFFATVIGTVSGAAGGWIGLVVDDLHRHLITADEKFPGQLMQGEYRGIIMHMATWLVISCGVGLVTGMTLRDRVNSWRPIFGAAVGGAAAAAIYPLLAALAFPANHAETLIPDGSMNQLGWLSFSMLMIAAGVCRVLSRSITSG